MWFENVRLPPYHGNNRYQSGFQNGDQGCISIVVTDFLVVQKCVGFFFFFQELGKQWIYYI